MVNEKQITDPSLRPYDDELRGNPELMKATIDYMLGGRTKAAENKLRELLYQERLVAAINQAAGGD